MPKNAAARRLKSRRHLGAAVLGQAGEVVAEEAAGQARAEPERERAEEDEAERTLHGPRRVASAPAPDGSRRRRRRRGRRPAATRTPVAGYDTRPMEPDRSVDRPLVPAPLARGRHRAPSSPPTTSPRRPGWASCAPAGRPSMRPSRRMPCWRSSCPTAAGSAATRSGSSGTRRAGRQTALNGSGRAPAAADAGAWRRAGGRRCRSSRPRSITTPGAVRSWGEAHARHGRLVARRAPGPAIELAAGRLPGLGRLHRGGRDERGAISPPRDDLPDRGAAWASVHRPAGRRWRPGEVVRLPALARTLERLATAGFDDLYDGDLAAAPGAGLRPPERRSPRRRPAAPSGRPGRSPSASTIGASGRRAIRRIVGRRRPRDPRPCSARFEPPPPSAFGPAGVTDPRWVHLGIEASKLAMADRDALLADPAMADDPAELAPVGRAHCASSRPASTDRRAAPRPPALRPPRRRARSTSRSSTARATR